MLPYQSQSCPSISALGLGGAAGENRSSVPSSPVSRVGVQSRAYPSTFLEFKGRVPALSQSSVCARCALSRCFMLLATLESSWLLSAHQPATGRHSRRPASRERPDSTDRVSCRCLLLAPL